MNKIFLLVLFLFAIFTFPQLSYAAESTESAVVNNIVITQEQVNPKDQFSYGVKRFKEKIMFAVFFYSKDKQAEYLENITKVRLAELKYVIETDDMANFENSTQRYFTAAGNTADFIIKNNLHSRKSGYAEDLSSYIPVLESLRDKFDHVSAQWRFVHDTVNYSKIYIDQLK